MVYLLKKHDTGGEASLMTGTLIAMLAADPNASAKLPYRGSGRKLVSLFELQGAPVDTGKQEIVLAVSLSSCASVCFTGDGKGYVYHANTGTVPKEEFDKAIASIGLPAKSISVCYAHPNKSDSGYAGNIQKLIGWGIKTDNIVEIENLTGPNFGMDNTLSLSV